MSFLHETAALTCGFSLVHIIELFQMVTQLHVRNKFKIMIRGDNKKMKKRRVAIHIHATLHTDLSIVLPNKRKNVKGFPKPNSGTISWAQLMKGGAHISPFPALSFPICWVDSESFLVVAWRNPGSNIRFRATFCTITEPLKPLDHGTSLSSIQLSTTNRNKGQTYKQVKIGEKNHAYRRKRDFTQA